MVGLGAEEVGGLEGSVGDRRPDLVNKNAENNSLDFNRKRQFVHKIFVHNFRAT